MFGFKNWRQRRREHKKRAHDFAEMMLRADGNLPGWKGGWLNIDVPGTNLLEPSQIRLYSGFCQYGANLYHKVDDVYVKIGGEYVTSREERTEDDPNVRRLLDLAYDYVWALILLKEKQSREAKELEEWRREKAIKEMIAHDDAQLKPLGGGSLTAF